MNETKKLVGVVGVFVAIILLLYITIAWANHLTYCKWGVPTTPVESYAKQEVCN
jgi:hypothetical protein